MRILITHGAKNLDAGNVAKDAAIDGGISAVTSVFAIGVGKALGKLTDDAWSAVGKASNSDSWSKAFMKAFKLEKSVNTIKPIAEGVTGTLSDVVQDKVGPDFE